MYALGEILGVEVYKQDAVVKRRGYSFTSDESTRSEVKEFTWESRRRLAFVVSNTTVTFRTMITLTYPGEYTNDGTVVKRHLNRFLTWLRRDTGGCSYVWFLEFQARGAPHFHILIDTPYPNTRDNPLGGMRLRVACNWYRIVGSRDYRHLQAGTQVARIRKPDGAARYATKYAYKLKQKAVPPEYSNVGRLWGTSRDVPPKPIGFVRCTEDDIRGEMEDWPYKPRDDGPIYRVLYNQGSRFNRHLCSELDKTHQE
jgi:hypothetical protein